MTATTYISEHRYRQLSAALRAELLAVLNKGQIVGRYAANVESDLRALGEHDLARKLYR